MAGRVVDLGLALAWLGPGLLILGLEGLSIRRAGALAFCAGLAAGSAILHWIFVVTVTYGHAPVILGVLAPIAVAVYLALFTSAFAAGWVWLRQQGLASPLAAAMLWTALDHGRSFLLSGFPWATLGYAQHRNSPLLGLAAWTGVYGLSFATVLGGAGLAACASSIRNRRPPPIAAWGSLLLVAGLHLVGPLLRPPARPPDGRVVRIAALQGNIDQGVKWSPASIERTLQIYESLSRESVAQGAQVVVWPETAVPGSIDTNPALRRRLSELARQTGALYVLGAVGIDFDSVRDRLSYFDSAFLLDAQGDWGRRYDKSHLVPFGEYVPLRRWLGRWIGTVASGIANRDVSEGSGPDALAVRVPGPPGAAVMVGVPICYELLFPNLVRRFVKAGAGVLLALTNDAWYGRTGAPYQFLAMTVLRSAETGVWTVRAANTGVSAIIDGRGRVRKQTALFERGLVIANVPVAPHTGALDERGRERAATFYVRHGDLFAWFCWIGVAALGIGSFYRRRTRNAS